MVLIFTHTITPRLQYISHYIFRELLGVDAVVVNDLQYFNTYTDVKINYSETNVEKNSFQITPVRLLFEDDIRPQKIDCFTVNNSKAFFKTQGSDHPFDVFAAAFYLLTRYEEYLPHNKDAYGRYAHTDSFAFKENCLSIPLINYWAIDLANALQKAYKDFSFQIPLFKFQPTYDIDMAYSYKHKGIRRNIGGFLRSPSIDRIAVLFSRRKDPFDSYQWLNVLHEKYMLKPLYFFLVAEKNGQYDKNILLYKNIMWKLVKFHAKKYILGLHPSWQSGDDHILLSREKKYLEAMSEAAITRSRQHYIRFDLPATYHRLIEAGITAEYSMGYGSINGFRASVANPFYWYDLLKNEQTFLRVHPFCFMDANAFYEEQLSTEQAYESLLQYYSVCKQIGGTLTTIFHNNFLGTGKAFTGWREVYERFIAQLQQ